MLTFSDVQAEITRDLVLRGATVLNFNQRSIAEILEMVTTLARLVGKPCEGEALVGALIRGLDEISLSAKAFPWRPRVFFEEWNEPLISGIRWVEELVLLAGGEPIFPELRGCGKSKDRVVDPSLVIARNPEVIIASWCGMKVKKQEIRFAPWLVDDRRGRKESRLRDSIEPHFAVRTRRLDGRSAPDPLHSCAGGRR